MNSTVTGTTTQFLDIPPGGANGIFLAQGSPGGSLTCKFATYGSGITYDPVLNTFSVTGFDPTGSAATSQANAIQRANHTGSQLSSTISDFTTSVNSLLTSYATTSSVTSSLAGKVDVVGGLQLSQENFLTTEKSKLTALNSANYATTAQGVKADSALQAAAIGVSVQGYSANLASLSANNASYYLALGNHTGNLPISSITNLQTTLDAKASSATLPLILTSGVLSINAATGSTSGVISAADKTKLDAMPSYAARSFSTPTFTTSTTATQLSSSRDVYVSLGYDATVTISLLSGQSVTANLKYADNVGMSTNSITVDSCKIANSGVLNLTQTGTLQLKGIIPAGKYRQVTFAVSGTGAAAPTVLTSGQEVLLP